MRQVMLAFFEQAFCVPDPVAGLAGTGGFVMPQMTMQRFNKSDSFTQGNAQGFFGFQTKLLKVFHAVIPTAIACSFAMITSFAGRLEHVLVSVIPTLNQFFDHFARIQKRFYELLLHWRSPFGCHFILGQSAGDLNRWQARMSK
ncbi:MAG: hypothetical protein KC572_06710 [Gammaproteobacteria bacterium]|nr:hypothetical protein [Gammaproteobacteria bacterium]